MSSNLISCTNLYLKTRVIRVLVLCEVVFLKFDHLLDYFSYNSVVIISYFLISFVLLIFNIISKGKVNRFMASRRGNILNPMFYVRLIFSGLCHVDWNHFKSNFLIILLIGPMLEEKYGSLNLLYMLLITSAASGIFHLMFYKSSTVGASDNVFMMVILCSIVNITAGKIPITLILIVLFYVIDEILGMVLKKRDGVSHDSHIIGAICGFIFGYIIFK